MLRNVVKLQTKGVIYLAVGCIFNVVLERMFEVLVAADSPLRFQRLSSTELQKLAVQDGVCL